MNLEDEMLKIANKISKIKNMPFYDKNRKKYDKVGIVHDLKYTVEQLEYFYDTLVPKQNNNPSKTFYKSPKRPKEHQVAYFNLTRNFPKELYGGHYCYVVKDFKSKLLVIPLTSIKDILNELDEFEYKISVKDLDDSILQLSDMRCVDMQRIYPKKGIFEVESSRQEIEKVLSKILFQSVDSSVEVY